MWFETLTGFKEISPDQVRANIVIVGDTITSKVNDKKMVCGRLETPTLGELRDQALAGSYNEGTLALREVIADVQQLHTDPVNAGSLFQVASQFNLLEMTSPTVTPEEGVGIYESDLTQGPACAIAAGAGTIYRNYLVEVNGIIGQSADNQINCLADMGKALGNTGDRLWQMQNGYALASEAGLVEISESLKSMTESQRDSLRQKLRIGIQWNTQVTLADCRHMVAQAYCSALPVAYSPHSTDLWEEFARLVLEASYEAALYAGLINQLRTGNKTVYLTLLGGGAYGNKLDWIFSAIKRALGLIAGKDLDIAIVSYGSSKSRVRELVSSW